MHFYKLKCRGLGLATPRTRLYSGPMGMTGALAEPARERSRSDARAAVACGRRRLLACERIEACAIADELGVNRTTLYRWFGGRDRFLAELLWSLVLDTLAWARSEASGEGPELLISTLRLFGEAVAGNAGYRHLLRTEPEAAARALFTAPGNVRERLLLAPDKLLGDVPAAEGGRLAAAIIRVGQAFLYGDHLGGAEPNPDEALGMLRLILAISP